MKRVVILQNEVMEYRKPVFDGLAKHYDITVVHTGRPSVDDNNLYAETILPSRKIGPFFIQNPVLVRRAVAHADAVIVMFDLHWPIYLSPVAKCGGRNILWGHRYSGNHTANRVRDWLMKKADGLLMYGSEDIDLMIARGARPERIFMGWNTIHIPNHRDYSQQQKSSLLFVGRLQPRKRIDELISSFARCLGRIPQHVILDIVGSGDMEPELKVLVEKLGLSKRVRFHGAVVDHEVLAGLFSTAFAYVSPGPVGLGALHSFAYGVPVITCREERHGPEFENVRNDENAIVYRNHGELDQAITKICGQSGLSSRLGRCAYRQYEARSLECMLRGFRDAIEAAGH